MVANYDEKNIKDESGIIGLPGVSDATKKTLSSLDADGYKPSAAVTNAMKELNTIIAEQPAEFRSSYYGELSGMMNKILGRKDFSYDLASDPMYRMYRDQYTTAGRRAMQDSMGQAAQLTGGYGSSYSGTVGQQAYNRHLSGLNDRIPELYEMARDKYDAEGDELTRQYEILNDAYNREYGAYQDEFDRWLEMRDDAESRYRYEADADRSMYSDDRKYQLEADEFEYRKEEDARDREESRTDRENEDREYFYGVAMDMLERGITPSANLLRSAGLNEEDIALITGGNKKKSSSVNKQTKSSSSKKKTSSKSSGSSENSLLNSMTGSKLKDIAGKLKSAMTSK